LTQLNIAQTIFSVFYAIFWGAVFSVSGRWKHFNFGLIFDNEAPHVTRRILLSKLILNILPILYFVWILCELNDNNLCSMQKKCWIDFSAIVLSGIIPAFAILGFYRLWIGIVEYSPKLYYEYSWKLPHRYTPYFSSKNKPEPGLEELGILPSIYYSSKKNIFLGLRILYWLAAAQSCLILFH